MVQRGAFSPFGLHNVLKREKNCKKDNIGRTFEDFSLGIDSDWLYNKLDIPLCGYPTVTKGSLRQE